MHKQSKFWLGVCLATFFSVSALESEVEAGRRNRIMPVSYTHLTLPTKRIV